ncbi:hypothetical protein BMS3Abin03_03077 [bacterium BMS3Abin03]|nr:hypothetical protein BMS3Abin03_03077 [bacterium BMS3Abin03]
METTALIFIPDISGYTKFVTETEAKHSKHIISELIEVILNANQLGMEVSEIEGDAVLFFRKGDPPKLTELIEQAKRMFLDFHVHIRIIQRDNVCQCGACRTAVNLTLKFITHFGFLEEVAIRDFNKIMGSDVILAHRLLKNNVPENEYLLMTDDYFNTQELEKQYLESWVDFKLHMENFSNFKNISIKYIPLTAVRNELPDVTKFKKEGYDYSEPDITIFINAPVLLVHELLTDFDAKLEYIPGLKKIKNHQPINRINASHTCVFDDLEIHFVTRFNGTKEREISYIEEVEVSKGFAFVSDYKLKEEAEGTVLSVKIFPGKEKRKSSLIKKIILRILRGLILYKVKKTAAENLNNFKEFCERKAIEREKEKFNRD